MPEERLLIECIALTDGNATCCVARSTMDLSDDNRANLIVRDTLQTEALMGGVIDSTRNGCRGTRCPSARNLTMVRENTVAHSEGAASVWTVIKDAVGSFDPLTGLSRVS
ncbi:hypothetical protein TNCV_2686801 [Trichonephila clavipes]|nr:hypothetical protein TNCV_2686801 [Trichonephila clavipes]